MSFAYKKLLWVINFFLVQIPDPSFLKVQGEVRSPSWVCWTLSSALNKPPAKVVCAGAAYSAPRPMNWTCHLWDGLHCLARLLDLWGKQKSVAVHCHSISESWLLSALLGCWERVPKWNTLCKCRRCRTQEPPGLILVELAGIVFYRRRVGCLEFYPVCAICVHDFMCSLGACWPEN